MKEFCGHKSIGLLVKRPTKTKGCFIKRGAHCSIINLMNFGKTFLDYCSKLNLGNWITDSINNQSWYELTETEYFHLNAEVNIFDGRRGGLILGNSHLEGGIHLLQYKPEINKFRLVGEMEGWEFITAPLKNQYFREQFDHLNKSIIPTSMEIKTDFNIPKGCPIIDTQNLQLSILFISVNNQYIINRFATKEHINNLIELNEKMSLN